jgi:hypothetical protein
VQSDHWEIVAVQNRYGEACDRRNWALFDDVFIEDVVTEYAAPPVSGRAERVASIRSHLGGCGPTQHLLGNYNVAVDGDEAEGSVYVRAFHVDADRPDLTYEMFGMYHDRFVRTPLGWRISYRRIEVFFELGTRDVLRPGP